MVGEKPQEPEPVQEEEPIRRREEKAAAKKEEEEEEKEVRKVNLYKGSPVELTDTEAGALRYECGSREGV